MHDGGAFTLAMTIYQKKKFHVIFLFTYVLMSVRNNACDFVTIIRQGSMSWRVGSLVVYIIAKYCDINGLGVAIQTETFEGSVQ